MREKLVIRSGNDVYEPFIKTYPKFNTLWLTHEWELTKVIEGYLDDPEFKEFYEYLRSVLDYEIAYIERVYTKKELLDAQLLHLKIRAVFEPTGEEVGTQYEFPCTECYGGRIVKGALILDLRRIPKGKDIAATIAGDEWVVSQRLAELLVDNKITGFELRPLLHKADYSRDTLYLSKVPSGKKLLEIAESKGLLSSEWEFTVWLNKPEQAELLSKAEEENAELLEKKYSGKTYPKWYQLRITSTVKISEETRYGDPFQPNLDIKSLLSPCGHSIRHAILSELYIKKDSWDGSDFVKTDYYFGSHEPDIVFYPAPVILISQRFYRLLQENKVKGYKIEVAPLVS